MDLLTISAMLAMGTPPQPGQQGPPAWTNLIIMVPLFVVFYMVLIRPQQKKSRELAEMLKSVRAGDKIVTSGGVLAVVVTVKDKTLMIRSADSKFEVQKSAIAEITERSSDSSPSQS